MTEYDFCVQSSVHANLKIKLQTFQDSSNLKEDGKKKKKVFKSNINDKLGFFIIIYFFKKEKKQENNLKEYQSRNDYEY